MKKNVINEIHTLIENAHGGGLIDDGISNIDK